MNFTKIQNLNQLKVGDKVAVTNTENLGDLDVPNVNLLIGWVSHVMSTNGKNTSVEITTNTTQSKKVILTEANAIFKSTYKITYETERLQDQCNLAHKSHHQVEKELKKANKLNRKYRAMLIQRFGATEEQIDRNFDNLPKSKKSNFIAYKTLSDDIPCIIDGKIKQLSATVRFSSNSENHIKCELIVPNKRHKSTDETPILVAEAVAICHEEDVFNTRTGEFIAYNKAFAKAICKLH